MSEAKVYKPSNTMLAILAGARARYMDYDTMLLKSLREEMVNVSLVPGHDEATYWLFSEGVKAIDDIVMGRAVV